MIKKLLKEPLVHFVIIGGLLFLIFGMKNDASDSDESYDIRLDESDINRLISTYRMSWNNNPDSSTLAYLINTEVESEIYYREAKRLDLHHNDEIIKRRLKQKYEFLMKDMIEQVEPTADELQKYYDQHKEAFASAAKISFEQYYFQKEANSAQYRSQLKSNVLKNIASESFHIGKVQKRKTQDQLAQNFGSAFAKSVFQNIENGWINTPVTSGFGYHLVNITGYEDPVIPKMASIKIQLTEAWKEKQRISFNKRLYEGLKSNYNVHIDYTAEK